MTRPSCRSQNEYRIANCICLANPAGGELSEARRGTYVQRRADHDGGVGQIEPFAALPKACELRRAD
jgi:hypothetical protein